MTLPHFHDQRSLRRSHGFYRVACIAPPLHLADPLTNAGEVIAAVEQNSDADLIVFPELGLTGYTCGDLFLTESMQRATHKSLQRVAQQTKHFEGTIVVGLPWPVDSRLMNVAAVVSQGRVQGLVPKTFLPNYREFYEKRHFRPASSLDPETVWVGGDQVPFGTDLLFVDESLVLAIEICEDLWVPIPPSSQAALAGANLIANLSASNELIGKAEWRRDLVRSQSGRLIAAYAYTSAGLGESTSDLVFGGHNLIAENGVVLGESRRIGDGLLPLLPEDSSLTRDVDLGRLIHDRQVVGSFDDRPRETPFRRISIGKSPTTKDTTSESTHVRLHRTVDAHPFVPADSARRGERCAEILAIQTAGLARRLKRLPESLPLAIGVSGGLDSTLALIVAVEALDSLGRDRSGLHGLMMRGFGTSEHTRESAQTLVDAMGITPESIDVRPLCLQTFRDLSHSPMGIAIDDTTTVEQLQRALQASSDPATDLTFENVQARIRTMLLMNRGFVIGTGDMSEQALGWSTYNGDHMSMYNPNTSIPKTLVRDLVLYAADHLFTGQLHEVLHRIAKTPISPELLPLDAKGQIRQNTESTVGPYELHDFFLYHFVRGGCDFEKVVFLASHAKFDVEYSPQFITKTLRSFIQRFFANQFKRNCVPDGPKVGSVSLSPRGDWRMPADAGFSGFLPEDPPDGSLT